MRVTPLPGLLWRRRESKTPAMSAPRNELLRAVELALAGKWEAAHNLVQQHEADVTAAWIHAVLHKIEGDLANSRHWYRHAGRLEHIGDEPRAELAAIKAEIVAPGGVKK